MDDNNLFNSSNTASEKNKKRESARYRSNTPSLKINTNNAMQYAEISQNLSTRYENQDYNIEF